MEEEKNGTDAARKELEEALAKGNPRYTIKTAGLKLHPFDTEGPRQDDWARPLAWLSTEQALGLSPFLTECKGAAVAAMVRPKGASHEVAAIIGAQECRRLFAMARLRHAGRLPPHLQAECDAASALLLRIRFGEGDNADLQAECRLAVRTAVLALQGQKPEAQELQLDVVQLMPATEDMSAVYVALHVVSASPGGERAYAMGGYQMYAEFGPFEDQLRFDEHDQPYLMGDVHFGSVTKKLRFYGEAAYEVVGRIVDDYASEIRIPSQKTQALLIKLANHVTHVTSRKTNVKTVPSIELAALETLRSIDHAGIRYPAIITVESPTRSATPSEYCVVYVVEVGSRIRGD